MSDSGSCLSSPMDQPASPVQTSNMESRDSNGATSEFTKDIQYEFWSDLAEEGDAEWPYRYLNARAYPMTLGSVIGPSEDYQYEIVEKLGWGGYSTVWLGWGIGEKNKGQWSAIKIFGANEGDAAAEVESVKRVRDCGVDAVEFNGKPFQIPGPRLFEHNTYLCLPMKLSGTPIRTILARRLYFEERLELAINAVEIMEKMHSGGHIMFDFSASNLLLKLRDEVHTYSRNQMRQIIGRSQVEDVSVTDRNSPKPVKIPYPVPHQIYRSAWLYPLVEHPFKLQVTDVNQDPSNPGITTVYASPELLSTNKVTAESSIWGLGVLICEIMTGHLPFEGSRESISEEHKRFLESTPDEQMRILRGYTEMPRDSSGTLLFPDYETDSLVELLQNIFTKKLSLAKIKDWLFSMEDAEDYWSEEDKDHLSDRAEDEEKAVSTEDVLSLENDEVFSDTPDSGTPI